MIKKYKNKFQLIILHNNQLKFIYQNPNETALSIGKQAPIPNHTATKNPRIKVKLAIGRRNGF